MSFWSQFLRSYSKFMRVSRGFGKKGLKTVRNQTAFKPDPFAGVVDAIPRIRYWMAPAILKIGRYMAITKPPIVTPRNTSMIGSIRAVMLSTAWSTSSS